MLRPTLDVVWLDNKRRRSFDVVLGACRITPNARDSRRGVGKDDASRVEDPLYCYRYLRVLLQLLLRVRK